MFKNKPGRTYWNGYARKLNTIAKMIAKVRAGEDGEFYEKGGLNLKIMKAFEGLSKGFGFVRDELQEAGEAQTTSDAAEKLWALEKALHQDWEEAKVAGQRLIEEGRRNEIRKLDEAIRDRHAGALGSYQRELELGKRGIPYRDYKD